MEDAMSCDGWKKLTVADIVDYVALHGGADAVLATLTQMKRSGDPAKYPQRTLGHLELLENKLGESVVDCLLSGEMHAIFMGPNEMVIEPTPTLVYDKNGRRIPPTGMRSSVCDANYGYYPTRIERLSFAERLVLAKEAFVDEKLEFVSAEEFALRINALVQKIEADETVKNVLKGAWYPFCIPAGLGVTAANYGAKLDKVLVPTVARAYTKAFPNRPFHNNITGQLAGEVTIWAGSRHERVLEAASKEPVVGIYFPTALQGYSINADREQMETLPEMFMLAGGLDTLAAMSMYAAELLRDNKTPCYDMAALAWRGWSLFCFADGDDAYFYGSQSLDGARGSFAGGLVALSPASVEAGK
ncbi:MAG: hypothetical protein V1902_01800 [Candidatus Falkowbacteria bacterium]